MNWLNAKAGAAIAGVAVLAGMATYLVQQRQIDRLHTENRTLVARHEQATAELEVAAAAARARETELERLRKDTDELLRLRNEVAQLKRQREVAPRLSNHEAPQTSKAGQAAPRDIELGKYVSKEQLTFAGSATPEAALQSLTWAMVIIGDYDKANASLSPELLADELGDPKNREEFETRQKIAASLFKGIQIAAKKTLAENRVELKVKADSAPLPNSPAMPEFVIQTMVKIGNEWKLGGSTREHRDEWERDGQIQTLSP